MDEHENINRNMMDPKDLAESQPPVHNTDSNSGEESSRNRSDDEYSSCSKPLEIDEDADSKRNSEKSSEDNRLDTMTVDEEGKESSPVAESDSIATASNDCAAQSSSLKVPRLKIICSKGDFSLVFDNTNEDDDEDELLQNEEKDELDYSSSEEEKVNVESTSPSDFEKDDNNFGKSAINEEPRVLIQHEQKKNYVSDSMSLDSTYKTDKRSRMNPTSEFQNKISETQSMSDQSENATEKKSESSSIIRRKLRSHTRQQSEKAGPSDHLKSYDSNEAYYEESKKDDMSNSSSSTSGISTTEQLQSIDEDTTLNQSTNKKKKTTQSSVTDKIDLAVEHGNISQTQTIDLECDYFEPKPVSAMNNCMRKYIEMRSEINKHHECLMKNNLQIQLPNNYYDFILYKKNYLIKNNKEARLSIPFVSEIDC
jgi:hypothetical protein